MCGVAGALYAQNKNREDFERVVESMTRVLEHRGPDDSGVWIDAEGRCGLGFRRLSIIDLSPNGHQPMQSPSGRFTVIFNGEIYNHADIRVELVEHGFRFRGHSDTETLCAAMDQWGVRGAITRCVGMFAIAAWDAQTKTLSLVRDRLGIKPLYLYKQPGLILFGSELKALKANPDFQAQLDINALGLFLRYLYVPAPATIFENVSKIKPGHIVTVQADGSSASEPFWSLPEVYAHARRNPFDGTEAEAITALEELLLDAVRIRKVADVPLGALLSGGIDSSTVTALMQHGASLPTRTFSIGFSSAEHDESKNAAAVAKHLGTDHTTLMLDGSESLALVPRMPAIFDEPFADPSQIPTYLVSQLARKDVTVALTGDGGDEVFAGYHRYIQGHRLISALAPVPRPVRRLAASVTGLLSDDLYPAVAPMARMSGQRLAQQKLVKLTGMLRRDAEPAMYRSLLSVGWQEPSVALSKEGRGSDPIEDALEAMDGMPLLDRMMLSDQSIYLADDLLAKVDRASMAVSLEARVPLLDHRVVEFAWRLPHTCKVRGSVGKWILRQVLYRHVPKELVERPKVGFTVPIEEWLRGPLRSWADDQMQQLGEPIDRAAVQRQWQRFQRGEQGLALAMWSIVMFQAWRSAWSH